MKISFTVNFHTVWGQKLYIVGSIPELGSWEPALAKEMQCMGDGNWTYVVDLPSEPKIIEYRYFLGMEDKRIFEEWEKNHRTFIDGNADSYKLYDYWQDCPENLAFYSSAFTKGVFAHPCSLHERVVKSTKKLVLHVMVPKVENNQSVAICGNQSCLGNWNPEQALLLSCDSFPEWSIELDASEINYPLEYKFLVWDNDEHKLVYWESDENRVLQTIEQQDNETVVVSGLRFRENQPLWRCAGSVIPVFSLRSEKSFGIGDLGDLRLLVDWSRKTGQRIIQVLPMNDTTSTRTWRDSYPYSAISIYALHPIYVDLQALGQLKDKKRMAFYADKQRELNEKMAVDYEEVLKYKQAYCEEYFVQEGKVIMATPEFQSFVKENEAWLMPYACYCYLRDSYGTCDFKQWESNAIYNYTRVRGLCTEKSNAWPEISFAYFMQFILHNQFKSVSDYARKRGVVLKGDLPIGVNRSGVDVWCEPHYFNLNSQAGAPPDDFSEIGQNWSFPTYNWDEMEKDKFSWWKRRFKKLSDYFDCFRIDHILGFFRIWEVPYEYVEGLCGHFNPALPLTKEEIESYGLNFNEKRFTTPHVNELFLDKMFGEDADDVKGAYLAQLSSRHYVLKPFCDTQRKIENLFADRKDEVSLKIKKGLFRIANEVLFLKDPKEKDKFHPRISVQQSYLYQELSGSERYAIDQLYWDFFYHRHNDFWKAKAFEHLTPLMSTTEMLVCGEDLGMIPATVPEVMNKLQIFSLEVERMPKSAGREFADMYNLPYHAVCTTSTHDMTPLRGWWKEDPDKSQRYFNEVLCREGKAPGECTAEIANQILSNHLKTTAMLTIIPLQDWFAMDDAIKRSDVDSERINIPANPKNYWRYRMHISLEQLMNAESFNQKVISLIKESGRQ